MSDGHPHPPSDVESSLEFERLLADLSARFVNLPADRVGAEIEDAQRRICDVLDIDRSALWQASKERPGAFVLTHIYQRIPPEMQPIVREIDRGRAASTEWALESPIPAPVLIGLDANVFFPSFVEQLRRGDVVVVKRLSDLSPEEASERKLLERFGTTATCSFPLSAGGELIGSLTLAMVGRDRDWSEAFLARTRILAQVFANALARKRADIALRVSEERLRLAVDSAGAGPWEVDLLSERIWATPSAKALYGFPPDAQVDLPAVLERVHPDDRPAVRDRMRRALEQRSSYSAEYRVILPDGSLRWVNARGRPVALTSGKEPDRLMGVSVDVTDAKRAEFQLKESEARLAAAVDAAALGFYLTEEGTRLVFVDDRLRELLAIPSDEEHRTREFWAEHLHPDDAERVLDVSGRITAGQLERVSVEYRYVRPDGRVTWFSHVSHLLERNAAGGAVRLVGVIQDITERKTWETELQRALAEVRQLRDELHQENVYLRREVKTRLSPATIIGHSPTLARAMEQAVQVAPTPSTVLLLGETGTGKERFASFIHDQSPRRERAMVRVNCAAIPATLIESELFGREKGAYTGALSKQIGRFELANGSTIFLDEVGELPSEIQVKLLRVLQEREFERLGSPRPVKVDVRIIAASNRDLEQAVDAGTFRQDLYYRLAVFPITIPPLRNRIEDLPLLVESLVQELSPLMGKHIDAVSRQSLDALQQYRWPGNVRELRNAVERALILATGPVLNIDVPTDAPRTSHRSSGGTLEEVERDHLMKVLENAGWRIRGPQGAAEQLGMKPTTLESRMAKLGIARPGNARRSS